MCFAKYMLQYFSKRLISHSVFLNSCKQVCSIMKITRSGLDLTRTEFNLADSSFWKKTPQNLHIFMLPNNWGMLSKIIHTFSAFLSVNYFFSLLNPKGNFNCSCYDDANTDASVCGHTVRMWVRSRKLMQIGMTSRFPTL